MKKIIFLILILSLEFLYAAQNNLTGVQDKVLKILGNIMSFLFSILMLLSSGFLIYVGIMYVSGKTQIKEGSTHKAILYLVLGIVLLITSFFIPNLIKDFIESSIGSQ
jgi:Na+-driven multidrug efflux pump